MGQEAGVRSRSGQVVTQKIDIKLVIIAEVIIEIQLGRGVTPERLFYTDQNFFLCTLYTQPDT